LTAHVTEVKGSTDSAKNADLTTRATHLMANTFNVMKLLLSDMQVMGETFFGGLEQFNQANGH